MNFVLSGFRASFFGSGLRFGQFVQATDVFSRENFDGRYRRSGSIDGGRDMFVPMTVIVIFEIFENVADVQEGVAVQADIHERRLHARYNAGDSAFVDAANA